MFYNNHTAGVMILNRSLLIKGLVNGACGRKNRDIKKAGFQDLLGYCMMGGGGGSSQN